MSWMQAALASSIVLLLGLLVVAWHDGYFASGVDWGFRSYAYFAVTIPYMLVLLPVRQRLWDRAIEGVQPLLPGHDLSRSEMLFNRRHEAIALLAGFAIGILSVPLLLDSQPQPGGGRWTTGYLLATGLLSNTIFTWTVYVGAKGSLHIAQLCKQDLKIDLFLTSVLVPFARWSQFGAIAIIGAIALTLPLQTVETLRSPGIIVSYAGLLAAAVVGFFVPLRRIHGALVQSQASKLTVIRANLQKVRAALEQHASQGGTTDIAQLHSQFAAWSLYEEQVKAASTWPFNHKMVKQVLGSTLVPLGLYWLKLAGGMLGRQLFL